MLLPPEEREKAAKMRDEATDRDWAKEQICSLLDQHNGSTVAQLREVFVQGMIEPIEMMFAIAVGETQTLVNELLRDGHIERCTLDEWLGDE